MAGSWADRRAPDMLVARIGGEEFALLADAARAPDAELLLARLRVASYPMGAKVTASLGLCTGPMASEEDWRRVYREADQALFAAKDGGRDRACWGVPLSGDGYPPPPLPNNRPRPRQEQGEKGVCANGGS